MKKTDRIRNPKEQNMKRVLWTLAALLLTLIAASMADAQTPEKTIDKAKCGDIERLTKQIQSEILRKTQEVQSSIKQVRPAIPYDGQPGKGQAANKLSEQASQLAKALVAAVNQPRSAAEVASEILNGSDQLKARGTRRASLKMFEACYRQDGRSVDVIHIIENNQVVDANHRCASGQAASSSIEATQVFQTKKSPAQVRDAFTRSLASSSQGNTTVNICVQGNCPNSQGGLPQGFPDYRNQTDYRLHADQRFGKGIELIAGYRMINETNLRISQFPVCGAPVYLVSVFGLPNNDNTPVANAGFDNSTLLGVIAPVGDKTLILGSLSSQTFRKTSESPMPLVFLDFPEKVVTEVFDKYKSVSSLIGAKEATANGEIGGDPSVRMVQGLRSRTTAQRAAQ